MVVVKIREERRANVIARDDDTYSCGNFWCQFIYEMTFLKRGVKNMPGLNFFGYQPVEHVVPEGTDRYSEGSLFQTFFFYFLYCVLQGNFSGTEVCGSSLYQTFLYPEGSFFSSILFLKVIIPKVLFQKSLLQKVIIPNKSYSEKLLFRFQNLEFIYIKTWPFGTATF